MNGTDFLPRYFIAKIRGNSHCLTRAQLKCVYLVRCR